LIIRAGKTLLSQGGLWKAEPVKESTEKRVWFPAKRYGWGWGFPCVWQGWVAFGVWILLMVAAAVFLIPKGLLSFEIAVCVLAFLLIAVCWWKGERPRWRWGKG